MDSLVLYDFSPWTLEILSPRSTTKLHHGSSGVLRAKPLAPISMDAPCQRLHSSKYQILRPHLSGASGILAHSSDNLLCRTDRRLDKVVV